MVESVDGPVAVQPLAAQDDAAGVDGAGARRGVTIFAAGVVVGHVVAWPWVGRCRRR